MNWQKNKIHRLFIVENFFFQIHTIIIVDIIIVISYRVVALKFIRKNTSFAYFIQDLKKKKTIFFSSFAERTLRDCFLERDIKIFKKKLHLYTSRYFS